MPISNQGGVSSPPPNVVGPTHGDRVTKRIVVITICAIALLFSLSVSYLAIYQLSVPDSLDRLATYVLGLVSGILAKTGVDMVQSPNVPQDVKIKQDGEKDSILTRDVDPSDDGSTKKEILHS